MEDKAMSKAQGDGFKTTTNHELNAYRVRLDKKLAEMRNDLEKWYHIKDFYIYCESYNILNNPRGSWKWDGWEITNREYRLEIFHETDVYIDKNGKYQVSGLSGKLKFFDNKDEANEYFKELVEYINNF